MGRRGHGAVEGDGGSPVHTIRHDDKIPAWVEVVIGEIVWAKRCAAYVQ